MSLWDPGVCVYDVVFIHVFYCRFLCRWFNLIHSISVQCDELLRVWTIPIPIPPPKDWVRKNWIESYFGLVFYLIFASELLNTEQNTRHDYQPAVFYFSIIKVPEKQKPNPKVVHFNSITVPEKMSWNRNETRLKTKQNRNVYKTNFYLLFYSIVAWIIPSMESISIASLVKWIWKKVLKI